MSSNDVRVPPGTLGWARQIAAVSLEDAAHRVGKATAEVARWEEQSPPLALGIVRDLADLYGLPLSALLWSNPQAPTLPTVDRRTYAGARVPDRTRDLVQALYRASALQQAIAELRPETGPLHSKGAIGESPDQLAERERERLGVSLRTQFRWDDEYEALNAWRGAVEGAGVFVLQAPMPKAGVRAFSLAGLPPVVVLNRSDYPKARSFSLLHEFAHVLVGVGGICEPGTSRRAMSGDKTERFCNIFAGCVLVPPGSLVSDEDARAILEMEGLPQDRVLDRIAARYQVSRGTVWYQLHFVGFVDSDTFQAKWDEWGDYFPPRGDGGGGATAAQAAIRDFGPGVVTTLLSATREGVLTGTETAQLLGVSGSQLDEVGAELTRRTRQ